MRPGRSTIDELPSASSSSVAGETGESWASEFERHKPGDTGVTPELASPLVASSLVPGTEIEYVSVISLLPPFFVLFLPVVRGRCVRGE